MLKSYNASILFINQFTKSYFNAYILIFIISLKKRRIDAFYNTDLQMILQLRNIRHIILSGIATGDVILSTCRSAADRDLNVTVVRECCFDGNESVQNVLMNELFPIQGVMVASLDDILTGLRLA